MKNLKTVLLLAFITVTAQAQTGISGFSKSEGDVTISLSSSNETYDEVLLAPAEIDGVPVFNDVTITSYNLYAEFGITDRFTVSVNMPYIISEGNATDAILQENGFSNKREGFQDLSLNFKYLVKSFDFSNSKLNFLANLGYETPMSKYEVDEGLQSILAIGNRSNRINGIGVAHFKMNNGIFATGQLGYSGRTNDVPNAILSQLKIGYAASKFYGDLYIGSQKSTSGVDILGEGFQGFFPATRVSYTKIGLNLYAPIYKGIGISAGASQIIDGRNVGKATAVFGGLNYSF